MKKRLFSILLTLCMVLCLVPTAAFSEGGTEEPLVCTCETACTAESMNASCTVCGADGALPENCGKYAAEKSGQTGAPDDAPVITAADVQALIDALPEAETISEDNAADVEAQLEAIDEAKVQLSDEDFADGSIDILTLLRVLPSRPRLRMTTPIAAAAAASQRATTPAIPM